MISFEGLEEEKKSVKALKPGANVKVILDKVELTPEGHLDFYFTGADKENTGLFKPRFFSGALDADAPKYNEAGAKINLEHLRHLLYAYLPNEKVEGIKANNTAEFYHKVAQLLTPDITGEVIAEIKHIYKGTDDTFTIFPRFTPFISTPSRPKGLKLGKGLKEDGTPWDRVLPMSHYGVTPDAGAPSNDMFSGAADATETEEELPFGLE